MPKKKAVIAQIPTKDSFFHSNRTMVESKKPQSRVEPPKAIPAKQRRFLYEKDTDLAYAEICGNVAISLDTGEELFRFGGRSDSDGYEQCSGFQRPFDFSPPIGKRHPNDRVVDTLNLVKAGILTDEDVSSQKAFTSEELGSAMDRLEDYRRELERKCGCV